MVVAQDPRVRDQDHGHDLDLVADPAPAQGIIVVLDPDQGTVGGRQCLHHFTLILTIFLAY